MSLYLAGSLEDIAKMFDTHADSAMKQASSATSIRAKQFELGRASAWKDAANMVRKTTLAPPPVQSQGASK